MPPLSLTGPLQTLSQSSATSRDVSKLEHFSNSVSFPPEYRIEVPACSSIALLKFVLCSVVSSWIAELKIMVVFTICDWFVVVCVRDCCWMRGNAVCVIEMRDWLADERVGKDLVRKFADLIHC